MALIYNGDIAKTTSYNSSNNYNSVRLNNAVFDNLIITSKITENKEDLNKDFVWDSDSIIYCEFDNTLNCGAIDVTNSSGFKIKRRDNIKTKWLQIGYISTSSMTLNGNYISGTFIDRMCRSNTEYVYRICPVVNGVEAEPIETKNIFSYFDFISVSDKDTTYYSDLESDVSNEKQNGITSIITTLGSKYPYAFTQAALNYITATAKGLFVQHKGTCDYDFKNAWKYRKQFREWLKDGNAKVIKHWDGRIWICSIGDVSDGDSDHHDLNITSFDFTEIADPEDYDSLVKLGLAYSEVDYG